MKKSWASAFGFIIIMFTTVVWAAPVSDAWQTICYDEGGNAITCPSPELASTECTAMLNASLSLHIPVLSYQGVPSLWADFFYVYNPAYPTLIPFKVTNAGLSFPTFFCTASTLSNDFKIHIPDVLLPDGITHIWVDLEFRQDLSTNGNVYFVVSNYGLVF